MNKINKNGMLLITSDLIYTLTALFVETFLVAYFLKVSNENLTTISIYYILIYFLLGIGNLLMGNIIKKLPNKSKSIMSLGIILRALFILFIVILSSKIANNFILIGIIYAFSEVLYWSTHEIIYIDITKNINRQEYISIKKVLSKIINIVAPIILGTSIELYSFAEIAIYVFALTIIQILITSFIKIDVDNFSKEKYDFKQFLHYINHKKLNIIKEYNLAGISYGIIESSISTLIVIITIMTFKTNFNLGILTTIFAIISILSLIIYKKIYNNNTAKLILLSCSIIILCGVIGLLINIDKITLIIYNLSYAIVFCIFDSIYNTRKGDLVNECNIEEYKEEYMGYTSISICLGRIIGYILMLIVSFKTDIIYFKLLLLIVTLFAPIYCYQIYKTLNNK